MIRNNDKVFGEKNDPNTVLATGILEEGKLIVGAGNKGIKTYNPGTKALIYINADGKVAHLALNTPNKVIGVNNSGELVFTDLANNLAFIEIKLDGRLPKDLIPDMDISISNNIVTLTNSYGTDIEVDVNLYTTKASLNGNKAEIRRVVIVLVSDIAEDEFTTLTGPLFTSVSIGMIATDSDGNNIGETIDLLTNTGEEEFEQDLFISKLVSFDNTANTNPYVNGIQILGLKLPANSVKHLKFFGGII